MGRPARTLLHLGRIGLRVLCRGRAASIDADLVQVAVESARVTGRQQFTESYRVELTVREMARLNQRKERRPRTVVRVLPVNEERDAIGYGSALTKPRQFTA